MAHAEQSPTTRAIDGALPRALGAAIVAMALAGLLIGALALPTTSPAPGGQQASASVTDGWMSYLGAAAVEAEVVDGWSSYLTPASPIVTDGWLSYLGAAAAPDVIDGWMSRHGHTDD